MTDLSLTGLKAELRAAEIGHTVFRGARVPIADKADLLGWRKSIMATVAKLPGYFTATSFDTIDDDHSYALRCVAITRLA